MTEKALISYICTHCAAPSKKKKLVYSVHHFSNFAFNNIWLCTQSADPITWSIFSDTRWFCLHTQPSVSDQIHFCFTACRQITRGEQSRACQPHTSPNKALAMHQQLLYTDLLQRSLSPLPVSPVQTWCILPACSGTAHFVQLSVLVVPGQLLHFTVPIQLKGTAVWMVLNRTLLANLNR